MNILVGGSGSISEIKNETHLLQKMSEYMAQKAGIFVGMNHGAADFMWNILSDYGYKKVTVYFSDGDVVRLNSDRGWSGHYIEPDNGAMDAFVRTMDRALFIWDQASKETFLMILRFALCHKPADVLLKGGEELHTVTSLEEVRDILPAADDWIPCGNPLPEPMYREILDICMPSEAMRNFLQEKPIPKEKVVEMVLGAPISLEKKELSAAGF